MTRTDMYNDCNINLAYDLFNIFNGILRFWNVNYNLFKL